MTSEISKDEVAIYDRQLRLWGVQAQQRLLKSRVLIWGLDGSNVEVSKNLVLAGIALTIRDHRTVTETDVAFNYFLRREDIGKNRAECASARIQEMNPLNKVSSSATSPEAADKLSEALKDFDFVILAIGVVAWDVELAIAIDEACRKSKAGFVLSAHAGEFAFFFSDLQEHVVQEVSSGPATAGGGGGSGGSGAGAAEEPKAFEPIKISFPALRAWLDCKPSELAKEKVDASVMFFSLLFSFLRKSGSKVADGPAKFEEYCRTETAASGGVPVLDGIQSPKDLYDVFFLEPLMPVASVVGGLMAQEVIKALTQRDPPLVNTVCFDAFRAAALVEFIPAPPKAPKRKAEEISLDLDD